MLVENPHTIDEYYDALVNKDSQYTGIFFVGVKTTSIFCIATCRARKPLKKNVEFYTTFKDALDHGYRPCKICQPTQNANESPDYVKQAIAMAQSNLKKKVKDWELRQAGISPERVRRWFKKNYGMTFQAYQRMHRINHAMIELRRGKSATETAFATGYESLSGFGYTFKKIMGNSPDNSTDSNVILMDRFTTPLGPMYICATDKGVCLLEFVDRRMLETEFKDLQRILNAKIVTGRNEYMETMIEQVTAYFDGTRKEFTVPLHTPGSAFQQNVWNSLHDIPYGRTASYQDQAIKMDKPKAIRAIASANGMNRIAVVVPCHRVIGKDGALRGYAGGLERKRWLLNHERDHSDHQDEVGQTPTLF